MSEHLHTHLIFLCTAYAEHLNISHWRVSFLARGDGQFFKRLTEGKGCTLRTPVWPVARISEASSAAIGAETRIASLSVESMAKQVKEHPELTGLDYLMVQRAIDAATIVVQDTPQSLIFVLEDETAGYVLVVKATQSGKGLFVTSFRRLSSDQVARDRELKRILAKGKD